MSVARTLRSACEFITVVALAAAVDRAAGEAVPLNGTSQGRGAWSLDGASPACLGSSDFPINGVRYIPHLVGEPYPHPESDPWGHYGRAYSQMHQRDLPLIGRGFGADTLALRPWPGLGMESQHGHFFSQMRSASVCKMVPTFHLAKYYADMLRQGLDQPRTDPASAFAVDFRLFAASVSREVLEGVKMVAWTVDLSLDLEDLLPLVGKTCEFSLINLNKNFRAYRVLLDALQTWVYPEGGAESVAPALLSTPFLVPLDLSRAVPAYTAALKVLMECMSLSSTAGGWSELFSYKNATTATDPVTGDTVRVAVSGRIGELVDVSSAGGVSYGVAFADGLMPDTQRVERGDVAKVTDPHTRWLLSFAVTHESSDSFHTELANISRWIAAPAPGRERGTRAVIMAGTQAIRAGEANPLNSVNLMQDSDVFNDRYSSVYEDYQLVSDDIGNLDGFIYDEWMDDWDRGSRGPFYLATYTLKEMVDNCDSGGRFSHDIDQCSRTVGSTSKVFPEFFGLASISSRLGQHCMQPRFSQRLFGLSDGAGERADNICSYMLPSISLVLVSLALLAAVILGQMSRLIFKWARRDPDEPKANVEEQAAQPEGVEEDMPEQKRGNVIIVPSEPSFQGGHHFELKSARFKTDREAAWWLWTHVSAQVAVLERQVDAEAKTTHAIRARNAQRSQAAGSSASDAVVEDELTTAMRTIHRRTLEGFAAWCLYVAGVSKRSMSAKGLDPGLLEDLAHRIEENAGRSVSLLFAEALLLRVMESLGEQMLHCPERISFLLCEILQRPEAGYDVENRFLDVEKPCSACFSIDMDKLHDGLEQMNFHSNPYERKKMPSGKWEYGLNFDDINECGIQCRENIVKTYKEPSSAMVVLDFFLCYRIPIMLKIYALAVAGYIFLGSHVGDDITTRHNGGLFTPKWLRINYIQYTALVDGALWVGLEVMLIMYVLWQRWPSLSYKSPGVPGLRWAVEHLLNVILSALGASWVWSERSFVRKPWECAHSDTGRCTDSARTEDILVTLKAALAYWLCRGVILVLMNCKHVPIFIYGTPGAKVREGAGRGCWRTWAVDLRVNLAWLIMLAVCIVWEVYFMLRTMKGLDWSSTCGWDILGEYAGLPFQEGVCSDSEQVLAFGCVTCVSSISAGWLLVFLGCMVDLYFVFYLASAVVGSVMGHRRQLNDLKNTAWPIDLKPGSGREALLFERTFGPGWQQVWRMMVKTLCEESHISPKQATGLVQTAGISMDGQAPLNRKDKKNKLIDLQQFPTLAAERLAFFFQSLKWIEGDQASKQMFFNSETDALTADKFDPGSIPSLTQIIPVYNETLIPTIEFLRAGAEPEDAKNSTPDDHPGLGDLTVPPQGDGVNTNLAFVISQFPEEWVFLAKRLTVEGWIERAESHQLYQSFMKQRLNPHSTFEVQLWAAMRIQSVVRTIIGALQYGRALASLPKIKEHYADKPGRRIAEDHAEVILAHQTYGNKSGNPKNDEAVRFVLEKYCDDVLYLVFDLNKNSYPEILEMVTLHLEKSGHGVGSFAEASVKCKWDRVSRGLEVVEVLPRKFPLRLGSGADYMTQGKAANQLNALRFAQGHYVQALDCNMGAFIGECFKIPYVLRYFMPLDQKDRSAPRCRFLGFREYIYAQGEGTVGKCQASAEWTFGTIYQRFLSGMSMRMHYGHPDFLDGFWARNRGGMSKGSGVVNLSEDIFAGFNVRMREEASPHIDALEFEKGRESTINAASNFFAKIAGGSVAIVRSRDNHLICERIGLLHSLSYYFASVAFYVSNLLVDFGIYLYVAVFVLFALAGLGPGRLSALGSTFQSEWLINVAFVSALPQVCERILEMGAMSAFKDFFRGLASSTFFFIFQNKNIAAAVVDGTMSGIARYLATGRPPANQHQTWKDMYITYWRSHYGPAMNLAFGYAIYIALAMQNHSDGKLPMVLIVVSIVSWLIVPIAFSPFQRFGLIGQDVQDFNNFIVGGAGTVEADIPEVLNRGKRNLVRSLYECGLYQELSVWSERSLFMLALGFLGQVVGAAFITLALPSEILDYMPVYLLLLSVSWVLVFGYFSAGLNNVFLVLSFLVWVAAPWIAPAMIGSRFDQPTALIRMPEYIISFAVFLYFLNMAKSAVLIFCRALLGAAPCASRGLATRRLHECTRICFVYFGVHQLHIVKAYIIMALNLLVASLLATIDRVGRVHTWFLLNSELARTKHSERYMEKKATFAELDGLRDWDSIDLWSSDCESDIDSRLNDHDDGGWA